MRPTRRPYQASTGCLRPPGPVSVVSTQQPRGSRPRRVHSSSTSGRRRAGGLTAGSRVPSSSSARCSSGGLDPTSPDRLPEFTDHEAHIVIVCNEGYSSSLAAASLQDLGLVNATDLDGGFRAWKRAGLPIVEPEGAIE